MPCVGGPIEHDTPVTVAVDAGPLLGQITGIGAAVGQMIASLDARDDVALRPYALSFRGTLQDGMTRLPLPAMVAQRLWSRAGHPRLDHWLRPAQVLHGTNYVVGPSRLPRLVTVYDCWFLRNPAHAAPDVARAGDVLRRAVATGALVHASSHATADAVRELLHTDRVEVVPLAALPLTATTGSTPISDPAIAGGAPFVLAIGTLERRKNLPRLVAAFGAIAAAHPALHLVLAGGDGDDIGAVDTAIAALTADGRARVVRTGRVDNATKRWLLEHARLLAYPSLDEGFGFPLLEAMQHDLPIVASDRGSIPEVAGDAALQVGADDVDALAAAIDTLVTDDEVRSRLVRAGHERLSVYSWPDTARQLAALHHRLAEEGS
ncbi:MAG: putative glycosyltransferase [Ilumatobacteraceae bacterium]|nr:putative glycosyltransferase [Ilumatobacteraceae bacterium]